jgi:hypothetical protein
MSEDHIRAAVMLAPWIILGLAVVVSRVNHL